MASPISTIPFSFTEGGFDVNKNDLIATVSSKTDLSKADAAAAIDGVFDAISEVLTAGGEVRLVVRGESPDASAEDMFTSPEDPKVKAAGDKKPDKPILSYIIEPPLRRADPAWPTLRCTHHKRFDLIARHRRIGKGKDAPIILEVLQTRKKIIRKPR